MNDYNYWEDCLCDAAWEVELDMTPKQLSSLSEAVQRAHEHYDYAFYTPPSSDRLNDIERVWEAKYKELQQEYDEYKQNAEAAVKRVGKFRPDTHISIEKYGEVEVW